MNLVEQFNVAFSRSADCGCECGSCCDRRERYAATSPTRPAGASAAAPVQSLSSAAEDDLEGIVHAAQLTAKWNGDSVLDEIARLAPALGETFGEIIRAEIMVEARERDREPGLDDYDSLRAAVAKRIEADPLHYLRMHRLGRQSAELHGRLDKLAEQYAAADPDRRRAAAISRYAARHGCSYEAARARIMRPSRERLRAMPEADRAAAIRDYALTTGSTFDGAKGELLGWEADT